MAQQQRSRGFMISELRGRYNGTKRFGDEEDDRNERSEKERKMKDDKMGKRSVDEAERKGRRLVSCTWCSLCSPPPRLGPRHSHADVLSQSRYRSPACPIQLALYLLVLASFPTQPWPGSLCFLCLHARSLAQLSLTRSTAKSPSQSQMEPCMPQQAGSGPLVVCSTYIAVQNTLKAAL